MSISIHQKSYQKAYYFLFRLFCCIMDKVYYETYETYETSEIYDSMDMNQTEKEVISQFFVFVI